MLRDLHIRILGSAIFIMALVSVSGPLAQARGSDTTLASRIVHFSPTDDSVSVRCAGTLLTPNRIITAGHCIEKSPQIISVVCPHSGVNTQVTHLQVLRINWHTNHDVAIVTLNDDAHCSALKSFLALSYQTATTLFTINLADNIRNQLNILQANPHTYIADDKQCLTQGDSGTPAFTIDSQSNPRLAAILISGTSDCPALQILANVSDFADWVETVLISPISKDR